MAKLYPTLEQIKLLKVQPEQGELHLLHFLNENLDDSYEVYFQPFLNGDRPDIVIVRKDHGVLIIEVKDWDLSQYEFDERKRWKLKNETSTSNYRILSPITQVIKYKDNIFNLHIPNLLEKKIKNNRYLNFISCAVYFHNANTEDIDKFFEPIRGDRWYQEFLKYNDLIGRDTLTLKRFIGAFRDNAIMRNFESPLFNDDIYNHLKRYLQPPRHTIEQGQKIPLSPSQTRLAVSENKEQRIKGVMGSGKTTILAHRAVSALKRYNEKRPILILTYNITLKNYIHDKINQVRENFGWGKFYITNYHNLISDTMTRLDISFNIPSDFERYSNEEKENFFERNYYSNLKLFENQDTPRYATILIDEIQDYKRPWMDMVKKHFLKENGEYVLFGDEKQNIYGNELENRDIKTNVSGRPTELKHCFRSDQRIRKFAVEFQRKLLSTKYEVDDFDKQMTFEYEKDYINYIYAPQGDSITALFNTIRGNIETLGCHPNDVAILSSNIAFLKEFEVYYRYNTGERTNTMFETQEIWYTTLFRELSKARLLQDESALNIEMRIKGATNPKNTPDSIFNHLAQLTTLYSSYCQTDNKNILDQFNRRLERYEIDSKGFMIFYKDIENLMKTHENFRGHTRFNSQIKKIRDNKKFNFWNNSGTIKISTVHSFKGWEASTLFLIIHKGEESQFNTSFDELIYTGITRSKNNLVIINFGNTEYHKKLESITNTIVKD